MLHIPFDGQWVVGFGQARGKYTLEFKMKAVRLVQGGEVVPVTAKVPGAPPQTLDNRVSLLDD